MYKVFAVLLLCSGYMQGTQAESEEQMNAAVTSDGYVEAANEDAEAGDITADVNEEDDDNEDLYEGEYEEDDVDEYDEDEEIDMQDRKGAWRVRTPRPVMKPTPSILKPKPVIEDDWGYDDDDEGYEDDEGYDDDWDYGGSGSDDWDTDSEPEPEPDEPEPTTAPSRKPLRPIPEPMPDEPEPNTAPSSKPLRPIPVPEPDEPEPTKAPSWKPRRPMFHRRPPRIMAGRPYSTQKGDLLADAHCSQQPKGLNKELDWAHSNAEFLSNASTYPKGWTAEVANAAADEWLHDGQEEHASIASFSRFSLDLLRFAAPPQLLQATHQAAAEEVQHAKLAFGLAVHLRGDADAGVQVKPFPITNVEVSPSLHVMVSRTLDEGCIGESSAVARLAYTLEFLSQDSPARAPVEQLLKEEARHAALAWATVQWASGKSVVAKLDASEESISNDPQAAAADLKLSWGGRVPPHIAHRLTDITRKVWVKQWVSAFANGASATPRITPPLGPLGNAVMRASQLVSDALADMRPSTAVQI